MLAHRGRQLLQLFFIELLARLCFARVDEVEDVYKRQILYLKFVFFSELWYNKRTA